MLIIHELTCHTNTFHINISIKLLVSKGMDKIKMK